MGFDLLRIPRIPLGFIATVALDTVALGIWRTYFAEGMADTSLIGGLRYAFFWAFVLVLSAFLPVVVVLCIAGWERIWHFVLMLAAAGASFMALLLRLLGGPLDEADAVRIAVMAGVGAVSGACFWLVAYLQPVRAAGTAQVPE